MFLLLHTCKTKNTRHCQNKEHTPLTTKYRTPKISETSDFNRSQQKIQFGKKCASNLLHIATTQSPSQEQKLLGKQSPQNAYVPSEPDVYEYTHITPPDESEVSHAVSVVYAFFANIITNQSNKMLFLQNTADRI